MADTIRCPSCQYEIEVGEAISAQLRGELQKKFEAEMRRKDEEYSKREERLYQQQQDIELSKKSIDQEVQSRLIKEREQVEQAALLKAKVNVSLELKDNQQQLSELQSKLEKTQATELDLRRQTRELEEQKKEIQLTVARQLDQERSKIREKIENEILEKHDLKDAEKNKMINDMKKQINELQRKSEKTSQELQGEVLELKLEDQLRQQFPFDKIEPVPKGIRGADVVQSVCDKHGNQCGIILWESKNTKKWSDGWLPKLREDQRQAKADVAVLLSIEMPKDFSTFGMIDGVWITNRACWVGLTDALRSGLIQIAHAKLSTQGRQEKMDVLYDYLAGSEFRQRIEGIVEAFSTMQEDLLKEKRAIQKNWANREKQLQMAIANTAGLHGDLQGIIGKSLPHIKNLELPSPSDELED